MEVPKVFESEYRFMKILWEHEPINSTELIGLCADELGWSKSTTYTVIRRLSKRGVVVNENTIVRSLVTQEQIQTSEINELVDKTFDGSIPNFLAAFTRRRNLKEKEIEAIRQLIDEFEEK